jgi:hypothetical protein
MVSCLVFRFEQKKIQKQAAAMMAVAVAEAEEKGADVTEMGNEIVVEVYIIYTYYMCTFIGFVCSNCVF